MNRLTAIGTALLIPAVFDSGLIVNSFEAKTEVLIAREENEILGLDNIDRLIDVVEKAENNGNFEKALDTLERILAIELKELTADHINVSDTLDWQGWIYRQLGLYEKALDVYKRALLIRKKVLGLDHQDTIQTMNSLALTYSDLGLYSKAEKLNKDTLEIRKKVFGVNHIETSQSMNNLALVYKNQGLYAEAEPLYIEAIKIRETELGLEHLDTATCIDNLGVMYMEQRLLSKAEPLVKRALNIRRKVLGRNHPDTGISMNNLAFLYLQQGLYSKAESLYKSALQINEKSFGPDHPSTALSLDNLALVYNYQGLYKKAEPLLERALAINEKTLGSDHPDTSVSLSFQAQLYQNQGLYEKAETLFVRALAIDEKTFGSNHPSTASSLSSLGSLYQEQGLFQKAEPLLERALAIDEKTFGSDHPDIVDSLSSLGSLYQEQGLFQKAEPLLERALAIDEQAVGANHPSIATRLNYLGSLYQDQGLFQKAEPLFIRALDIREKYLGPDHPNTATTLSSLATLYQAREMYTKAESLFVKALAIDEKSLGPDHPHTATSLNNLGLLYYDQGLYNKAEPFYKRSLAISEKSLGPDHPRTATSLNNLGLLYQDQGRYKQAESLLKKTLKIDKQTFGTQHLSTSISSFNLSLLYSHQGLDAKAIPLAKSSLSTEFTLIQREAPYLLISDRKSFLKSFGSGSEMAFSYVLSGKAGRNLALFSRLNKQGLLEEIEKSQAQLSALTGPQRTYAQQLALLIQQLSSKDINNKYRQELTDKKEELERKLYRLLPALKPRIVEVYQVAKSIPSSGVLIEYQRYQPYDSKKLKNTEWQEERYLALTLDSKGKVDAIDLGLAKPIEDTIQQALIASERRLSNAQQLWNQVGGLVIQPLAEIIRDKEILFVSPDAELNRIPFATLSTHENDQLLGDVVKLRLLTTGREILDLAKDSQPIKQKPLVVANPSFSLIKDFSSRQKQKLISTNTSQQRSGDLGSLTWSLLPGTAKEGKAIAKLTNAQLLTENKATALAVQEQEAPKVLHIASHSYFLPDQEEGENPLLRSGIVLAGANEPQSNPKDDGYLTALEVAKLDLQGTELAVISGCESGQGEIKSGEGVYGLKRSLAVAGARSSLLSLWEVDDRATAAFMISFYQRLKDGEGRADALAATQKEFRSHPFAGWRHPYVWAAFQLSGDWRPIQW